MQSHCRDISNLVFQSNVVARNIAQGTQIWIKSLTKSTRLMTILVYDYPCIPQKKDQNKQIILILLLVFKVQISLELRLLASLLHFFLLAF